MMSSFMKSKTHQAAAGCPPQVQDVKALNSVLVVLSFPFGVWEAGVRTYLENRRESGGGAVDSLHELNAGTYVVHFHTDRDAVNAVSRQTHEVDTEYGRCPLSVFLYDERSGSVYSGLDTLHREQGGEKQTAGVPRVDSQAPDTVLVTGVPFLLDFTADSIKADIERLATGTHAVKSVRYMKDLRLAFVVFDDPNDARAVADKGTCELTDRSGDPWPVRLFLYRGTLEQHADVTQTAIVPGVEQARQWRQQLSTLDLSRLETLARAGTLTMGVKDTLTRRADKRYRQQLVARCETLVSDNPMAQALLSILSQSAEQQRSGDAQTASGELETARTFCDTASTDSLDTHTARRQPETGRTLRDTATNTDSLGRPGTCLSCTPGTSLPSAAQDTLVEFTDQSTDTQCKDTGSGPGPCETPGGSLTALPAESPGLVLEGEEEEFYDCVEALDLATADGSVYSRTGDTHPAAVEADLRRLKEEMRQFQSEVGQWVARLQSEVGQQVIRLQSEVTDPQSRLKSAMNRQQNQHAQLQALVMRGNERIGFLVNGLQDVLGQHGYWSQNPRQEVAGGALVVENLSTLDSTSGDSVSTAGHSVG